MRFQIQYPLDTFWVSQKFGENADYYKANYGTNGHPGWDMVGNTGQIIRAAHDGVVVYTGEQGADSRGGLGVVLRTNDIVWYNNPNEVMASAYFKSVYWHCLPGQFFVKPGQQVKVGDPLALCDSTGVPNSINGSGSHLHFGIKPIAQGELPWTWDNVLQTNGFNGCIDPSPYWSGLYAKDFASIRSQIEVIKLKIAELWKKAFA